jgi:hypothetical protein
MSALFADRSEAGRRLARTLASMKLIDPVVLALPRGGVPVAAEVAAVLDAPLDLLLGLSNTFGWKRWSIRLISERSAKEKRPAPACKPLI